jgi:hypothetical protein
LAVVPQSQLYAPVGAAPAALPVAATRAAVPAASSGRFSVTPMAKADKRHSRASSALTGTAQGKRLFDDRA